MYDGFCSRRCVCTLYGPAGDRLKERVPFCTAHKPKMLALHGRFRRVNVFSSNEREVSCGKRTSTYKWRTCMVWVLQWMHLGYAGDEVELNESGQFSGQLRQVIVSTLFRDFHFKNFGQNGQHLQAMPTVGCALILKQCGGNI